MGHGGRTPRRPGVAGRRTGHIRMARGGAPADRALACRHTRGARRHRRNWMRRDERHLLPALYRRARRPARLQHEPDRRSVEAVARRRAVLPAVHGQILRGRHDDRGPLGDGRGRQDLEDRLRPDLHEVRLGRALEMRRNGRASQGVASAFRPTHMGTYVPMYRSTSLEPDSSPPRAGELAELPLEHLEHELCELGAHIEAGMARWIALVGEYDRREGWGSWRGVRSSAEWIAWRCSCSPRAAREHVRVARALRELPRTRRAFSRGELSYSKVRPLTRVATADSEADLLHLARYATACQLERSSPPIATRARRRQTRATNSASCRGLGAATAPFSCRPGFPPRREGRSSVPSRRLGH